MERLLADDEEGLAGAGCEDTQRTKWLSVEETERFQRKEVQNPKLQNKGWLAALQLILTRGDCQWRETYHAGHWQALHCCC